MCRSTAEELRDQQLDPEFIDTLNVIKKTKYYGSKELAIHKLFCLLAKTSRTYEEQQEINTLNIIIRKECK